MANCLFAQSVTFNCLDPQRGGIYPYIIAINWENLADGTITEATGTTEEITNIVLDSGTQGYKLEVPKSQNIIASTPLREVDGVDGYDHTVDTRVNNIEQIVADALSKIRFAKAAIIVPLLEGRAYLYGRYVGMRLSAFDAIPGDPSTGGTINFVAKTPAGDPPEINPPHLIAAAFDLTTLLTPAP